MSAIGLGFDLRATTDLINLNKIKQLQESENTDIWEEVSSYENEKYLILDEETKVQIQSGTVNQLVYALVNKPVAQNIFQHQSYVIKFFWVFQAFLKAEVLMHKLSSLFVAASQTHLQEPEELKTLKNIRERTCHVVRHWFMTHYEDFEASKDLHSGLLAFIQEVSRF